MLTARVEMNMAENNSSTRSEYESESFLAQRRTSDKPMSKKKSILYPNMIAM